MNWIFLPAIYKKINKISLIHQILIDPSLIPELSPLGAAKELLTV